MEFKLHTLHFNATEQLVAFVDKKKAKLEKHDDIQLCELTLKVVKPETANNKEANVHLAVAGNTIHVEKVADTFEEAIDKCFDVVRRILTEKRENRG